MDRVDDRIDRTIELAASPDRVWRALTTPSEISAWFRVAIEGPLTPGAEVWMTVTGPKDSTGVGKRFRVRVVEMEPPRRFAWEWYPGAIDPAVDYSKEPRTKVTFTLEPIPGGTRLTLSETGFDAVSLARRAKVFADNNNGWTQVLAWFRSHVETPR
jgi:uncharacterized protein YndB with AHSA1/START domain